MTGYHGRPTAAELVEAVAEFLENDVRAATAPTEHTADAAQVNFHARVAANVLRIVERELLDETATEVGEALTRLGYRDERELAAAIRAGELDDRPDEVLSALRTVVRHRLAIDHPGYADG